MPSRKIDKYKYITGDEILPFDQRRVKEQAKFTCSSLGKALEKQAEAIDNRGKKQIKANEEDGKKLIVSHKFIK